MRRGARTYQTYRNTNAMVCKRLVINGDIKMTRVGGSDNCADLGTKTFGLSDHDQTLEVLWNAFCRRSESDCTPIGALDGN